MAKVSMNKRIFKEQTSTIGEIPFYKIGTFGKEPDSFISKELFEEYKAKYPYPKKGDLLISASGSIGKIVEYNGENAYFQDSNIVWLDHGGRINNLFLKTFYSIVKWKGLEGSTIKRLYNSNILKTNIDIPNIKEQQKIGELFKDIDIAITLLQKEVEMNKQIKKGFLQKLFPKE
ncbi:restriction endonuclease subunit S [Macrococcoides caseolyticum]|uniref:restriction endonuclease subunit S n=1 Tax=Macrococcoides caseolyticum TaxID=69966 RepID=UPI001E384A19|nr:restriction endonuclease subunit S [Macrococcus caseolyticus]